MCLGISFVLPFYDLLSENIEFIKLILISIVLFKTFQTSFEVLSLVEDTKPIHLEVFRKIVWSGQRRHVCL